MNTLCVCGEHGALFVGVVTNGDHVIEVLVSELVYRLRTVFRDVDAEFAHRLDCLWSYLRRRDTRTRNFETIAGEIAQQSFRHLAARGVAGT